MDTCRDVLRQGLPIKCIEAAFLGMYLTAGLTELSRFPVGFKSQAGGQVGEEAGGGRRVLGGGGGGKGGGWRGLP
jgi:hypothetical protein